MGIGNEMWKGSRVVGGEKGSIDIGGENREDRMRYIVR